MQVLHSSSPGLNVKDLVPGNLLEKERLCQIPWYDSLTHSSMHLEESYRFPLPRPPLGSLHLLIFFLFLFFAFFPHCGAWSQAIVCLKVI